MRGDDGDDRLIWVRRSRCVPCRVSHCLLPAFCLLRRLYGAEAIGACHRLGPLPAGTHSVGGSFSLKGLAIVAAGGFSRTRDVSVHEELCKFPSRGGQAAMPSTPGKMAGESLADRMVTGSAEVPKPSVEVGWLRVMNGCG